MASGPIVERVVGHTIGVRSERLSAISNTLQAAGEAESGLDLGRKRWLDF